MTTEGHLGPITPREAEFVAAGIMRDHLGFKDARVTTASGDGGVDVVAKQAVAQVKHWGSQVGRPAIQQLYGARGIDHSKKMIFFCSGGYSRQAVAYADEVGVALFTFDATGGYEAINESAKRLDLTAKKQEKAAAEAALREARLKKERAESEKLRAERKALRDAGYEPIFSWRSGVALLLLVFSLGPILWWADASVLTRVLAAVGYYVAVVILMVFEVRRMRRIVKMPVKGPPEQFAPSLYRKKAPRKRDA
ncbi:restriction endonuclease [Dietzia kunjamensis]|uniref:restriction endonuclease n=1 Tax=Dietzia kunjamensis TaxID=322509 RepID=UPI000E752C4F|nr:restriction endonuclease [Dietzia kunjamensis]MBB1013026.1 restriction endonuclease [Dietzia kunjamensis]RKE58383.1 restriction endonuclease [Dietzia kunjamensis]